MSEAILKALEAMPEEDKDGFFFDDPTFRRRNGHLSKSQLRNLIAKGLGPKFTWLGARKMVSRPDEQAWRERMLNPTGRDAEFATATAKKWHERAMHARTFR